ncbi:MAG TPA: BON domain-containing protein [Pyrinomonadaceae bacterium]|nr:BON domain-containing protein [Pyrinomonadaceae bacterium]
MSNRDSRPMRSRIVVEASARQYQRRANPPPRYTELWIAISIIIAAVLATFLALFITSRPYDPMIASVAPEQVVPVGPSLTPSPKASPTVSPTPQTKPTPESSPAIGGGETSTTPLDDATIQANIERALNSDPALSDVDVSTLVENGKVTVVGSVRSVELKQRVERLIRSLKGVSSVDNQLVITQATP